MSIYPVRIKKFFPPVVARKELTPDQYKERTKANRGHRETIRMILSLPWVRCETCGRRVKMRNGWVYHAMPWGYGNEAWCSEHCLKGGK